jgi:malonate-semialdehyde dehydrogenase (acetylating)/methylmalonate-semialdehyde dehydrogenase
MSLKPILNYYAGTWQLTDGAQTLEVLNPATQEVLGLAPLSGPAQVALAVESAQAALPGWRRTPAQERVQYLFRMKTLLEQHIDELARLITLKKPAPRCSAPSRTSRSPAASPP